METKDLVKIFDEYLERIRQSGKKESSDIAGEVKLSHSEIKASLDEIKRRLDTANGYTAKHEQRLNQLDVLNAQTALIFQNLSTKLDNTTATTDANEKYIIGAKATIRAFQWIVGVLGISNVALIVKLLV